MKWLIILMIISFNLSVAQSKKENMTVAVLEFQKTGSITNDDVQTLTNRFRAMLFQTKAFNVVERQKMRDILKEQEFILSDECSTNECAVQVGQLLGVKYMFAGDIGLIGDTYTIDLRMIDVSTGQLVQTRSKDYDGKISGLLEIMKQIAESFSQVQNTTSGVKSNEEAKVSSSSPSNTNTNTDRKRSGFWGEKNQDRSVVFRIMLGSVTPTGKFNTREKANSGANFMINCSYFLTTKVQVGIDLGSQVFNNDKSFDDFTIRMTPFMITGRYYTLLRKFRNYITLGFGATKVNTNYRPGTTNFARSFFTAKLGTGISYEINKKISAEMSLDIVSVDTKKQWSYSSAYSQFGLGINYHFTF